MTTGHREAYGAPGLGDAAATWPGLASGARLTCRQPRGNNVEKRCKIFRLLNMAMENHQFKDDVPS